ncbi:hypothetical protein [Xenorhabdus bovienii]|uniref:hypothetical protein n=1 Tax=Xenorhabdus bovienii TaxID=40576 RepID=UPI0023B23402|nr:hypothetical protein [Xenorhabdus bovienii]MDE9437398.1 hypothetical protein [Xenorhabdus bovienii]MDE9462604.1 hypothetical protein [Xenorhabdus bovienii]MDE9464647.1 hypothetical protein [Xenorhabdus bovienii]MDE9467954.1 hypothetical protein [Xenorhabdus bovienii]MDE9499253.1 hypothetical protein [Xenorhabdus bovienii]
MSTQSDYLPAGLPHNRGLWPQEYRDLENWDLKASRLIKQLKKEKISRTTVLVEIEKAPDDQREFFRTRLNYWREIVKL